MKLFTCFLMVLLATTLLSGCGDGPCDAEFSFKYCLNQSSSSSLAPTYTIGGTVTGLGAAQSVTLVLKRPAVSFSAQDIPKNEFASGSEFGWSFTIDTSKSISDLGLYNTHFDGDTTDTTVAIWNSAGQEVVKKVFTLMNVLGTEDATGFFWLPITQALAPGQYTIAAFSTAIHYGAYLGQNGGIPIPSYGVRLNSMSLSGFHDSLTKPTDSFSQDFPNGFFGPNLRFSTQKVISANGAFTFDASLLNSEMYTVTVSSQPAGATCVLTNASGKVSGANLTNLTISCTQNSAG